MAGARRGPGIPYLPPTSANPAALDLAVQRPTRPRLAPPPRSRGVVLEFFDVDGSGRAVQALVEPEMVRVWRDYSWTEHPVEGLIGTRRGRQPDGFTNPDSMYGSGGAAARQQQGGMQEEVDDEDEDEVVQLHVLTAERIHVGGELPDFVDVLCADGCPGARPRVGTAGSRGCVWAHQRAAVHAPAATAAWRRCRASCLPLPCLLPATANCLVDNLTLKPWTSDATASGEWLQFRARLEERWQVGSCRRRAGKACTGAGQGRGRCTAA